MKIYIIWETAKTLEIEFVKIGFSGLVEPGSAVWEAKIIALEAKKAVWKAKKVRTKKTRHLLFGFHSSSGCFYCNCVIFKSYLQRVGMKTNSIHNLRYGMAHRFFTNITWADFDYF